MDYKLLIDETKNKINSYTFDDTVYKGIYDAAKEKLADANRKELSIIDREHETARKNAMGENALTTKSLQEDLAARGLARSGESAMLKVNQALSLKNSLNDLAIGAMKSKAQLGADYNKQLADLESKQADHTITAAEKEKDTLVGHLEHLQKLQADRDKWQADYNLELYKENNRLQAEKDTIAKEEAEKQQSGKKEETEAEEPEGSIYPQNNPSVTPDRTAKNIISQCGLDGEQIRGTAANKSIRKALAELICTQGLSKEYAEEVLFSLVSYGFEGKFDINIATSKMLKRIYGVYENAYIEEEERQKNANLPDSAAQLKAKEAAFHEMWYYIFDLNLDYYTFTQVKNMLWMY